MAEGRILKRKASRDRQLAQLSDRALILYLLAIPHLDVDGRMVGLPATVRGLVVPELARARPRDWTDRLVASYIFEWTATVDQDGCIDPLVLWYATAGENVIHFTGFERNQVLRRDRESPSAMPAPPPEVLEHPALASAELAVLHSSGSEQEVEVEALTTGLSVARAREADEAEGLQVATEVKSSLDLSAGRSATADFGARPAGSALMLPTDDELANIFKGLRGVDDGTMHMLKVWRRRGCGEREFAIAQESLGIARRSRRRIGNEARYLCSELSRLLEERKESAA